MLVIRGLAAAAALALMPITAHAVTTTGNIDDGDTVDVGDAPFEFNASFTDDDDAGVFDFIFENNTFSVQAVTVSTTTINQSQSLFFEDGVTTTFGSEMRETLQQQFDSFELTVLIDPGSSETLSFDFGDAIGTDELGPDIDFIVEASPVPLPPALALMLGALGGLALLARRRES